ncbi:ABC transporter type 1/ ATPase component [Synechococcus sp. BIOS-U3-1]|uniref:ABC transporter ATP-binding protein n=1 Tax=Synechococcus sp. BIOS-U3-1 TaxID=1400865 RepID=UPI0016468FFC|nr:ABC transporter ATP-binding protein [Synechococcus sp. BIOS-U3-1]QNI57163.1 ABC transporter type 1/ ATPase component [Synechococcus sp. BIOS-U3-1]
MRQRVTNPDQKSTRILLLGILSYLSRRRRIQLGLLFVVMLASGVVELVSLGAVLPFLAVLSDPERLWQQPLVQAFAAQVGFTTATQLIIPTTLMFAFAAVFAALIRLTNLWLNGRFVAALGSDLSCEAYLRTLNQPYVVHVQRNSAALIVDLTANINLTVISLRALLQLITSALVAAGLFTGLLLIDAQLAVSVAALFGSSYVILATTLRRELRINGQKIKDAVSTQLKAVQEGLGAIRDVLLDGSQRTYLRIYRKADRPHRQLTAKNLFIGAFPRYALEAVGMVAIALLGGVLVLQRGSGAEVIPLLGALALGAQRLLPALQQIYSSWVSLKSNNAAIQGVLTMLNQPLPLMESSAELLPLCEKITLEKVHFRYELKQQEVLQGLHLEIYRGERIGIIGSTGSGKSTTVDLLMGLLAPSSGRLLVDGADMHDPMYPERQAAWRSSIAHVPQSIYLADSSIAENIAFGVPRSQIDLARVRQAAAQAQIANFIESSSEGYASFVGERGIRLSGGQRQRIGIARALYKQVQVLVLDEATSALDTATEQALMDAINNFSKEITIVMIAHRLSTVQQCDRVIRLERGRVVADGSPEQVLIGDRFN